MMLNKILSQSAYRWRLLIQMLFLGWCLFLGIQFSLFVRHFETFGAQPHYNRPPGVEGFLPIGALVSLKAWLVGGVVDHVHPAALVLFVTFLAMALLARKSFCSFLCPVGTLSEWGWKLGQRLFGRNFRIWRPLDLLLQSLKYLLLLFFVKIILIDMPLPAIKQFLASPYWAVADVKMLQFFTGMSLLSGGVILLLTILSLFYKNVWCRYLCPYGALLGLVSMFSPVRIRRNLQSCTDCGSCTKACPARIDVQHKVSVASPECTGCLTCVQSCPEPNTLQMSVGRTMLPGWSFVLLVVGLFATGVLVGMLSGHWESSLNYADYQRLISQVSRIGH
jgi:polyferredoxin